MGKPLRPGLVPLLVAKLRAGMGRLPVGAWLALGAASLLAGGSLLAAACGRSGGAGAQSADGAAVTAVKAQDSAPSATGAASAASGAPEATRQDALWARAAEAPEGEVDELLRLAHFEGSMGLVERAEAGASKIVAARAMAFVDDFYGAPFLSALAASGAEDEAQAALGSLAELAARPRRQRDPEDAAEMKQACTELLALAKNAAAPRPRRVGAVRALRMLEDRGCVKHDDVPTDVDTVVPAAK